MRVPSGGRRSLRMTIVMRKMNATLIFLVLFLVWFSFL